MQTTTMEELAERLYTAKAQMLDWMTADTLAPIPTWSETQRTVKNAWYLVAQQSIDAGEEAPPPPPPILFEASAGESKDERAIDILGPHPQWAALSPDVQTDWAVVGQVATDVQEDLRRDVKPLPLKKKQHATDEPVDLPEPITGQASVSSAQLLALVATPISLVPAPAAGIALQFVSAALSYTFGTLAYVAGANLLVVKANGVAVSNTLPAAGLLDTPASSTGAITGLPYPQNVAPEATALMLHIEPADVTGGDGTLTVDVTYREISTAPAADAEALEAPLMSRKTAIGGAAMAVKPPLAGGIIAKGKGK
jgi:hypothetical protein